MSDFAGKLPFTQNMAAAMDFQSQSLMQQMGWQLPCEVMAISPDGLFVTIAFRIAQGQTVLPQVTVPIAMNQYVRPSIQIGDTGVTKTIDVDISFISGQQTGAPTLGTVGNIRSVLFFEPIVRAQLPNDTSSWPVNADINSTWIYGVDGVRIQDKATSPNSVVTINGTGIRLQSGSSFIQINKDGSIDIEGTSVKIMGKDFLGHEHSGVQTGTSNTGGVA
jgi:hypothetical protein